MKYLDPTTALQDCVSKESQIEIARIINQSYRIVKQIEKDKDYLNSILAKNILSYLGSIVVEIQLEKAIKNNKLPYTYEIMPNAVNNHYHLEMKTRDKKYVFTVSQTSRKDKVPRRSIFRENHSLSNQVTIDDLLGIPRSQPSSFYILITHGHYQNDLKFINIGVPQPYLSGWMDRISLLEQPYIIEALKLDEYQEEKIENDITFEIKDLINRRMVTNE